ncbi:hypothetical protein ACFE04_023091 [Oxalis oulophora]
MGGDGREGDWECSSCNNKNYAFRSFCNRCKQPRLLVDTKTPADSKWLPRIGDWICTGCTNNNYASREKCKKCGQPKEVAAMPAIAIPGAYSHYFARAHQGGGVGGQGQLVMQPPIPWVVGGGPAGIIQPTPTWPLVGNHGAAVPYPSTADQVPKGWRNGDWICDCGFHNYSSRAQCKNCNSSMQPPALGTKRLASEDFVQGWDSKRLNLGQSQASGHHQSQLGFDQLVGSIANRNTGVFAPYPNLSTGILPNWQAFVPFPPQATTPTSLGNGWKHWRSGDWMCKNCNNHNYASRAECNRCKTQRDTAARQDDDATRPLDTTSQPVDAV